MASPLLASAGPNGFTERDYYLATVADTIVAPPEAYFEFNGFHITLQFLTGLLDKIDVEPEIIRAGKFKSAVEPYVRTDLSVENEEQLQALVDLHEQMLFKTITESRNIGLAELEHLADEKGVYLATDAKQAGLIDELLFEDEVVARLKKYTGQEADDDLKTVSLSTYVQVPASSAGLEEGDEGTVAVVYAVGAITVGEGGTDNSPLGGEQTVGSDGFARTMKRVRENDDVKAVVLRIDSPGGSSSASDVMWREIRQTANVKPVIASMGNYAASGGYYLAVGTDSIVANPTTLTGSIGVFAMMFNRGGLFNNKLGISTDGVHTGPYADMFTGLRALTETERAILGRSVDQTYETFLKKVADNRGMTVDEVDKLAQGRVWSGQDALDLGLVDELGGLNHAIEIAANKAGLEAGSYQIRSWPRPKSFMEQLNQGFQIRVGEWLGKSDLTEAERYFITQLNTIKSLSKLHGKAQARLPMRIHVD